MSFLSQLARVTQLEHIGVSLQIESGALNNTKKKK
jgi:hypothetical protein